MCANFKTKWITSLAQICPKRNYGWKFRKLMLRISILEILCVSIFKQNAQPWLFRPKFSQKWILGLEFQKINLGIRINVVEIPCVPIFRQNGQLSPSSPEQFLKMALAPHDFVGNVYLIWFVGSKTIEINLCNPRSFHNGWSEQ